MVTNNQGTTETLNQEQFPTQKHHTTLMNITTPSHSLITTSPEFSMQLKRSTSVLILSLTSMEIHTLTSTTKRIVILILVHPSDFLDLAIPSTQAQTLALNQAPTTLTPQFIHSITTITMERSIMEMESTEEKIISILNTVVTVVTVVMVAVVELLSEQTVLLAADTTDILMLQASEMDTMKKFTTKSTSMTLPTITILFMRIVAHPAVRASRVFPLTLTLNSSTSITPPLNTIQTTKLILPIQLTTEKDQPALELT